MNNTTNNKKTFKVILSLSILFILTGIYIYTAKQEQIKKVAKTEKKPAQRLKPLEYEGAMVVKDVSDINDIMNELENEPTAGGGSFDEQDIANSITKEALQAFSDSQEKALPLIAHWNVGGDRESIFNPSAMLQKLQEGDHILVSWKLEPYYNSEIPLSYYEESIKKAAALHLPLVFITPAPESALVYDNYYASLSGTQNPDVVTANGEILEKLSPFGDSELWNEVGEQWSSTSLMAQLQEWYPNPPLVIFVSENEVDKLKWSDVEDDVRYTDKDQDDNFKRTLIDAEWIEKYRQLHEGFKKGFSQKAWKDNVKFITYNKLSQNLGKTTDWVDNATYTNNYINIWPLTADGVTVDFNLQESESDNSANAPHVLINNLPFMLSEAKAVNPHFTYQLNINDNDTITTPARYRGLTQFALWFLRPSTIRQGSTLTEDSKLSTMFQEVVDSAEMIHYNTQLADFWKNGSLVTSGVSDLNVNVPTEYKNDPRWFLLNTDANPPRPWSDSTSISVWAFALVKGKAPNREWLLYAQSPEGDKKDVTITLPEYGDLMIDASEMGSFYTIFENKNTIKSLDLTNYTLIWNDEFNGNELDMSKWDYRYLGPRKLGYTTKEAIKVSDGTLKNIIYKENDKYCSGMISTQNKFETKYGYFEARIKVAHILGPQSAFWLQSKNFGKEIGNPEESGMEIDIMEYVQSDPQNVHFTTHWDGYGENAKKDHFALKYPEILNNEWHTFGLLWEEDSYKFYVDGKLVHEKKSPISQTDEYIILSAEIGNWGGDITSQKLPAYYEVDYVRVYQKK